MSNWVRGQAHIWYPIRYLWPIGWIQIHGYRHTMAMFLSRKFCLTVLLTLNLADYAILYNALRLCPLYDIDAEEIE